jgi:ribosomal protein S18 acetylase RimI-like enzyme
MNTKITDYHKYIDIVLKEKNLKIVRITKEYMNENLNGIMDFVNEIRFEHKNLYGWEKESKEYFLKSLVDKWKYSFIIIDSLERPCMISINSRYNDRIHLHTVLVKKEYRRSGLSKYMLLKTAETAIDSSIPKIELYCQKNNTGALILYLRSGFEIDSIRNNKDILLLADSEKTRNICYESTRFLTLSQL